MAHHRICSDWNWCSRCCASGTAHNSIPFIGVILFGEGLRKISPLVYGNKTLQKALGGFCTEQEYDSKDKIQPVDPRIMYVIVSVLGNAKLVWTCIYHFSYYF